MNKTIYNALYQQQMLAYEELLKKFPVVIPPIECIPLIGSNETDNWAIDFLETDNYIQNNLDKILSSNLNIAFIIHDTAKGS